MNVILARAKEKETVEYDLKCLHKDISFCKALEDAIDFSEAHIKIITDTQVLK